MLWLDTINLQILREYTKKISHLVSYYMADYFIVGLLSSYIELTLINERERIGGFSTPVKPFDESVQPYNLLIFFPWKLMNKV